MGRNVEYTSNSDELNDLKVDDNPARDFLYFIFDLIKTGILVFVLAFALRYFVIQPFVVDGESMMPNYVNSEYLLAEKVSYLVGQPHRGDVVIFRYPGNPNINYIKRIIALPGETIRIDNNQVTIKDSEHQGGVVLKEDYLPSTFRTAVQGDGTYEKTLEAGQFFVMGDNRQHSSDSREWGILPQANIIGRAWLTVVPVDRFKIHNRISYPGLSIAFDFVHFERLLGIG